ncbi:helicase-exonuclease AddAB subunit AddA [Heliorestis acidaminivorans]|uniref:ATP-dependent helicase/nuclease subunit A n=1 Tax=Heliorestis acidaminivorans TaxID=553427 RepID=A0A6I0F611_9FIRM|nr:helicase-exonuclease AddAB subunit AddA [Heliorestis acidaminivorans]KAB2952719.1 helicase-exonuclease AddAB subunit AddA [Heliorestis acidaminivorans]
MIEREERWTDEQWQAITVRQSNVLVAAAAGAGKTAVLVRRMIGLIQEGIDVDRLLVVTFTNSAAAEMRERIREAVTKALHQDPENKHLRRQLLLINRASITTLHSFCLDLVRKNYYRLELDPSFRIADETESILLQQDALDQLFENYYEKQGACELAPSVAEAFDRLLEAYSSDRDDSALQEIVLKLYERAHSQPQPEQWLNDSVNLFHQALQEPIDNLPWLTTLRQALEMDFQALERELTEALELCKAPGPVHYQETVADDLAIVADLRQALQKSWTMLYEQFTTLKHKDLSRKRLQVDEEMKQEVKDKRDRCKEKLKKIKGKYFSRRPEELIQDLQLLLPEMELLRQLTLDFAQLYKERKQEKRLVDFNDLEHYCLALLCQEAEKDQVKASPLAKELAQYYAEVLVDEYQDINKVQETILDFLSQNNRFMVGDVKQSIYRFRLAEPALFLQKYHTFEPYREDNNSSVIGGGRKIDLARNFRSRANVLHGVNDIFQRIMTAYAGEMTYDDQARLISGALYPSTAECPLEQPIELHLLQNKVDLGPSTDDDSEAVDGEERPEVTLDETAELERTQLEARMIGRRIEQLLAKDVVYDKEAGTYRPVTYRDIVILLRATKGRANVFVDEFRALGIPAYAEVGSGYFEATEIAVMMALLKVIDNPRQDIPLVALLRSPLFRFSAAQLAEIRLADPTGSFYEALLAFATKNEQAQAFLRELEKWRSKARSGPLASLIWQIYSETGFYDYVGAMVGGTQRQANLRALYSRALQYEKTSFRGLFRFLRFIERLQDQGGDLGTARALGEKEDVVRIMSIHKSKGLEFPVVFVPSLGNRFNQMDRQQKLLLHKELGFGPLVLQQEGRYYYPSIAKLAIDRKIHKESLAEEMRILYVALTRAKEKLILVGTVADRQKTAQAWFRQKPTASLPLGDQQLLSATSFLDWIGPVLAGHRDGQIIERWADGSQEGAFLEGQASEQKQEVSQELSKRDRECSYWSLYHSALQDFTNPQESQGLSTDLKLPEIINKVKALEPIKESKILDPYLTWSYRHDSKAGVPTKVSVSQLKNWFTRKEESASESRAVLANPEKGPLDLYFRERPRFLQKEKVLSGSERGSAVHMVMQHIAFAGELSLTSISQQIDNLVQRELLTREQRQAISDEEIYYFFHSPLGKRMLSASKIMREIPFSLALPLAELAPWISSLEGSQSPRTHKEEGEELVLLQGVIDCLFEEQGEWFLVDYKTDRIGHKEPTIWLQDMSRKYRSQLGWYEKALQEAWGIKPQARYLYFFSLGQSLEV